MNIIKLNKYIIFILVLILATSIWFIFKKSNKTNEPKTFVVGTAAGYAPWVSVNDQGEYEGFDVDVMNVLSEQMGKNLVMKDLGSMSSLFMALEQNKIDAIIWGMSMTQDRLKRMNMICYQGELVDSFPLIFWKKIPYGIKGISDMVGKSICVEPGSSQDTVLSKYPFINKITTEKVDDALFSIMYGKADAAFVEPAIANKFIKKYPAIKTIDVQLAEEEQVAGVGVCIRKDNTKLSNEVEQAILELRKNGVIQEFESRWGIV